MLKSITKIVSIDCFPFEAFHFLSDPKNWPSFELHSIKTVTKAQDGYWNVQTTTGTGQFKMQTNPEFGIIDYLMIDGDGMIWPVSARIVDATEGTHFIITYTKQTGNYSKKTVSAIYDNLDDELRLLKMILETTHKQKLQSNIH